MFLKRPSELTNFWSRSINVRVYKNKKRVSCWKQMVHSVCHRQSTRCYWCQYFEWTTPGGFLYLIEERGAILRMRMSKALVICQYAFSLCVNIFSRLFRAIRRQKYVPLFLFFFFEKESDTMLTFREKRLIYSFHKTANLPVSSCCHDEKQLRNDVFM